jgi:hypothetical protein
MAQETNYVNMLPPMAKNLLGTVLTEKNQIFLSNPKNQDPLKIMAWSMTKEGRAKINEIFESLTEFCKQFD